MRYQDEKANEAAIFLRVSAEVRNFKLKRLGAFSGRMKLVIKTVRFRLNLLSQAH